MTYEQEMKMRYWNNCHCCGRYVGEPFLNVNDRVRRCNTCFEIYKQGEKLKEIQREIKELRGKNNG